MKLTKKDAEQGLKCCREFLCGECPYNIIEGIPDAINLKCIRYLMNDLYEYMIELEETK